MHRQGLTPEQQQQALDRKLGQGEDYVLPVETRVIHEGQAAPASVSENAQVMPQEPVENPDNAPILPDTVVSPTSNINNADLPPKNDDIKSKIKEYEEKLRGIPETQDEATFRDSTGNETYYVKNISGQHVVVSDINLDKVKVGVSVDLLESASLEDLKKSRDLRSALGGIGKNKLFQRLTETQYLEEIRKEYNDKQKIEAIRRQENVRANAQAKGQQQEPMPHERTPQSFTTANKIRPVVDAKLGKLSLRDDPEPENSRLAMTSIEFIQWIQGEPLNQLELDHILGHPTVSRDQSIRVALLEKKRNTPS